MEKLENNIYNYNKIMSKKIKEDDYYIEKTEERNIKKVEYLLLRVFSVQKENTSCSNRRNRI